MESSVQEKTVEVPTNTGVEGFVRTIRTILKMPRVQSIHIDSRGRINFKYVALETDDEDGGGFKIDFDNLEPYYLIRQAAVDELSPEASNAAVVLTMMLDRAALENLYPIAFVTSPNSILSEWYALSTGYKLSASGKLCGLPVLTDRHAPDTALLLCLGYTREASMADVQKSYKIEMDMIYGASNDVEVL